MDLPKLSLGKRYTLPRSVGSSDALLLAKLAQRDKAAKRLTAIVTSDATDAQRLMHAECQKCAALGRDTVLKSFAHRRKVLKGARRTGHQRAAFFDGLAIVQPLQGSQRFTLLSDQARHAMQDGSSLMRQQTCPIAFVARGFGKAQSLIHIGDRGRMQAGHLLTRRWVFSFIARPTGITPLAGEIGFEVLNVHTKEGRRNTESTEVRRKHRKNTKNSVLSPVSSGLILCFLCSVFISLD